MHGRVHGTYTAVHTGRKDGRVHGTRPVHGHVYGTYTVGYGPRTRPFLPRTGCVHGRVRDTDGPCAWPVYGRAHSLYTAEGGRTQALHGRPQPCTDRVHGRARAMYMVRP